MELKAKPRYLTPARYDHPMNPRKSAGSPAVPGRSPVSVLCAQLGFSFLILSSCEITEETHSGNTGTQDTGHCVTLWGCCHWPGPGGSWEMGWADSSIALWRVSAGLSGCWLEINSAANRLIGEVVQSRRRPLLPTRAFSWLKVPTSAFTFKTLC